MAARLMRRDSRIPIQNPFSFHSGPPMQDALLRFRYRYWPDHLLGEILSKRWTETAIPVIVLLIVTIALSRSIPGFLSTASLGDTGRQAGEIGFVVLGMALVVIVGGIDLSVGSMFALCDFCALYCLNVLNWPVPAVIVATLVCGAVLGSVNGLLIGYLRLRAFITTLITLIIYRSAYDLLLFDNSTKIAAGFPDFPSWNFMGGGVVAGIPAVVLIYVVVAMFGHVFLTRLRPGWHVTAIGGSRRSAYNSGIPVRRTIALCYTASGVLTAIGALFFAARLGTVGGDVGVGLEVTVLTATVLGGISLGGGKGSVAKALVGTLIVLFLINGLTTLSVSGGVNRMVLAAVLLVAAVIDIRWLKNRNRIISKVYVSPTFHGLAPADFDRTRQRAVRAKRQVARRDVDRRWPHRSAGRCHPRSQRLSLRRLAPWRHHALHAARLPGDGSVRPYRRPAARHGVRSRR